MKATWAVAVMAMGTMAATGCTRTAASAVRAPVDFIMAAGEPSAIRAGEPRVVDGHLNLRAMRRAEAERGDAQRIALRGGGYMLCWTTGSAEQGRSAVAQSFNSDGSARGAAVVISRPDVDVMGTPRVSTNDAGLVVATFAAAYESSIALVEVPLEVSTPAAKVGDLIAASR